MWLYRGTAGRRRRIKSLLTIAAAEKEQSLPVKDPGARVVSGEADSYVVSNTAGIDDVSLDRVVVVVCAAPRASNDAECML
jgi:hypothetical protein